MYKQKIIHNSNIIAVKDEKMSFSYNELYFNAKKLHASIDKKVIGIYMKKSAFYIQAIYYSLLSDITFIPLNPLLPKNRIDFIIEDSNIDLILTTKEFNIENSVYIEDILECEKFKDFELNEFQKEKYIIYTSGTTGNPKGCILSDKGIDNVISQQVNIFQMKKSNIFLYLSINFDASLSDIICSFYSESTLFIEDSILKNISEIKDYFLENKISHVDIPPSFLSFFKKEDLPTLKNIIIGGEIASKIDDFPRVVNVYGPTEATICTSYIVINKDFQNNCIGKPLENVEYKIDNGTLHIKSIQLFNGYKNIGSPIVDGWYDTGDIVEKRDELYYFLGRKDNQIKHHGNMINLDEIDAIIKKINVNSFIKYENNEIILYTDKKISRDVLDNILPSYMIPHKQYINDEIISDKTEKKEYILKSKIIDIFKDYSDYESSLKELGVDSLKLIEYSLSLSEIGIYLDYETLLHSSISEIENKEKNVITEENLLSLVPKPVINKTKKGNAILVVGASGFLGIHLVKELVSQKKEVFLFVREYRKYYEAKKFYGLDIDESLVTVFEGDLLKENLGVKEYSFLEKSVGTIYFMAGEVNNIKSLNQLYNSNIKSVENILKFKGDQKELIFASTLSVKVSLSPQDKIIDKNILKSSSKKVLTGYAQSKWIADKLVSLYPNVYIMRYGMLLHNIMAKNSFYSLLLKEIDSSKIVPKDKGYSMDNTSVVFAAKETIKRRELINNITENKKIFYKDLIIGKKIGSHKMIEGLIEKDSPLNIFETTDIKYFLI